MHRRLLEAKGRGAWDLPANANIFLELRRRELEMIDHFWPFPSVDTILEVGGGPLVQSAMLATRARRYVVIDLAETHGMDTKGRADLARIAGSNTLWPVIARGEQVPLRDRSVDLVYSSNVFEHVDDQRRCVREIARTLRPGGHCVLVVPVPWTRVNYFVEQYLLLVPNVLARAVRFLRKRYGRAPVPGPMSASAGARLRHVREEPLLKLLVREFVSMLRFRPHGEHYAGVWEELLDYRVSKWRSLFPSEEFELVKLFTDRLNIEWFGSRTNLWLYRILSPVNRRLGDKWPFYHIGHEVTFVYRRRSS